MIRLPLNTLIIAGPCAAESREQVLTTARLLSEGTGCTVFRAGVWKPRTQPGHFEGVGEEALSWLREVKQRYALPVATEVATPEHLRLAIEYGLDYVWLGARTTTSPFMVQALADALRAYEPAVRPCVLVKNPLSPDIRLWQGAVERILEVVGEERVMMVHRGFSSSTPSRYRNAPMWSLAFEMRRMFPHIPLLNDASHMAGDAALVLELSEEAMKLGYEGLMLEVHPQPEVALSDARQQLSPEAFHKLVSGLSCRCSDGEWGLEGLRREIDELDESLWNLIVQRMHVSRRIGEAKKEAGIPILRRERYEELLTKRLEWAKEHDLDPVAVRTIMDAMHEESCRWQL